MRVLWLGDMYAMHFQKRVLGIIKTLLKLEDQNETLKQFDLFCALGCLYNDSAFWCFIQPLSLGAALSSSLVPPWTEEAMVLRNSSTFVGSALTVRRGRTMYSVWIFSLDF